MIGGHCQAFIAQLSLGRPADAELSNGADYAEARHVGTDQKSSHARNGLTTTTYECLRERGNHAGAMTVPDPDLAPIQSPVGFILAECRRRLDVLRIGADVGL